MRYLTYKQIRNYPNIISDVKGFVNLQCNQCKKPYSIPKKEVTRQAIKNQKENNFCSMECSGLFKTTNNTTTLNCEECQKIIKKQNSTIKKSKKSFCSSSCGARFYNKNRPESTNKKISNVLKRKFLNGELYFKPKETFPHSKIKFRKCRTTGLGYKYWDEVNGILNKRSPHLNHTERHIYKLDCQFKFNVYHYPDEFDISLVETFGWYTCPSNKRKGTLNVTGVSRDHLYSISDGFKNKIDPSIISHPANCIITIHTDNVSKGPKSSITLDELMKRVSKWNEKYV